MNVRQIEAFKAVIEAGTVTDAAELMRISQPAVSRLIADLESSVKLALFSRSKGRLHPTPEAMMLFHEVERSFLGMEKLRRAADDIRNFRTGHLRVVSLPALGFGFVPKVARRFHALYPEVTLSIQVRSSAKVRELAAAMQFDIGLAGRAPETPGVSSELFSSTTAVCVLPPGHALAQKDAIEPTDLANENFISLIDEDPSRPQIDRVFEASNIRRRIIAEAQFSATVCSLVLEGMGVSVVHPLTAEDFRGRGLVIRPFPQPIYFDTMLLFPTHRPRSRLADAFVATLKERRDEVSTADAALKETV